MKSNDQLFIKISEPTQVRRGLLESSKLLLRCMQGYEDVRRMRERKMQKMHELRELMRETSMLIHKFRMKLPKQGFSPKYRQIIAKHDIPSNAQPARLPTDSEVEVLEKELAAIEQKLRSF